MDERTVVNLEEIRARRQTSVARLLKDPAKVGHAIETRTCIICGTVKSCVNRAGVCSYCFAEVLTPEEQTIAREEARHKIIKIQVIDDRLQD